MVISVWLLASSRTEMSSVSPPTTRRVQQVKVAGLAFRVKRTLNGKRPDVMSGVQEGFLRGVTKLQGKRRLPAFVRIISDLSC